MRIGRTVTTITADGSIISKEYRHGCGKALSVCKATCSPKTYKTLREELENCIETANKLDFYVDDRSESLKIFYEFSLVKSMDCGFENHYTHIGCIMNEFLSKYLDLT